MSCKYHMSCLVFDRIMSISGNLDTADRYIIHRAYIDIYFTTQISLSTGDCNIILV